MSLDLKAAGPLIVLCIAAWCVAAPGVSYTRGLSCVGSKGLAPPPHMCGGGVGAVLFVVYALLVVDSGQFTAASTAPASQVLLLSL